MPLRSTERSDGRTRPRWKDGSRLDAENDGAARLPPMPPSPRPGSELRQLHAGCSTEAPQAIPLLRSGRVVIALFCPAPDLAEACFSWIRFGTCANPGRFSGSSGSIWSHRGSREPGDQRVGLGRRGSGFSEQPHPPSPSGGGMRSGMPRGSTERPLRTKRHYPNPGGNFPGSGDCSRTGRVRRWWP
jgi:hypothetical protein